MDLLLTTGKFDVIRNIIMFIEAVIDILNLALACKTFKHLILDKDVNHYIWKPKCLSIGLPWLKFSVSRFMMIQRFSPAVQVINTKEFCKMFGASLKVTNCGEATFSFTPGKLKIEATDTIKISMINVSLRTTGGIEPITRTVYFHEQPYFLYTLDYDDIYVYLHTSEDCIEVEHIH
jgi:hypothetical protein